MGINLLLTDLFLFPPQLEHQKQVMEYMNLAMKTSFVSNSCYLCTINFRKMDVLILPLAVGPWQIVLVVLIVLLLFGGRKIPELMRGLGSGIKEFKDASKEDDSADKIEDKK
jgi:sec-independent protein translocase protein TatA